MFVHFVLCVHPSIIIIRGSRISDCLQQITDYSEIWKQAKVKKESRKKQVQRALHSLVIECFTASRERAMKMDWWKKDKELLSLPFCIAPWTLLPLTDFGCGRKMEWESRENEKEWCERTFGLQKQAGTAKNWNDEMLLVVSLASSGAAVCTSLHRIGTSGRGAALEALITEVTHMVFELSTFWKNHQKCMKQPLTTSLFPARVANKSGRRPVREEARRGTSLMKIRQSLQV